MTRAETKPWRLRSGAGYGGLLAVGDPHTVAGKRTPLADNGCDRRCCSVVASNDALSSFPEEALLCLERLGVRPPLRARLVIGRVVCAERRCPRRRAMLSL
jgi:hypothetical protein